MKFRFCLFYVNPKLTRKFIKISLYFQQQFAICGTLSYIYGQMSSSIRGEFAMNIEQKLDKEISTLFKPKTENEPLEKNKQNLTYNEFLSNKMLIIKLIRTGVPYSLFDLIRNITPFSETDWAELLNLSTKSLHRYRQDAKPFKPLQSEKIIEMAEVTNVGVEVFGNTEKFKLWLDTPNFALGSFKPMELLRDSYGKEMVIGELTRINHGILV